MKPVFTFFNMLPYEVRSHGYDAYPRVRRTNHTGDVWLIKGGRVTEFEFLTNVTA